MIEPWTLPSSWRWAEWTSVARVASNLVDPANYGEFPHVAPNHIESRTGRLLAYRSVGEDGVTSAKHLFRPGQVLYSKIRPYLAKVVLVDFPGLCSADMYPVDTELEPGFLKWWMLSPTFTRLSSGEQARTVLPKINKQALGRLPVPVPPIDEQRRIVAILEDHLSRLDAADEYIRSAQRRGAVLSDQLLASELRKVESDQAPLRELLEEGLSNGKSVPTRAGGFPVLRLTALRNGRIDLSERKEGAWTADDAHRFLVRSGDFLIARGNGSLPLVGRGGLVEDEPGPVAFPDTLIRARPDISRVQAGYLALVWNAPAVRRQIERSARTTAGIYKVNQKDLGLIHVPVPSLADQAKIVAAVGEGRDRLSQLTEDTDRSRSRATTLRRALLNAAFSGHLTGSATDLRVGEEMMLG